MLNAKKSSSSSSIASKHENHKTTTNGKHTPQSIREGEYDYLGRLVTDERPVIIKSKSLHEHLVHPSHSSKSYHSTKEHLRGIYEDDSIASDDNDDFGDLNKPFGVIRLNDRHHREIYRVPTPPPQLKKVVHRVRSPKTKIIERVYVHRPPQEIIENIIEVPPEITRVITREKYLKKRKPIIRTKVIHLKSNDNYQNENRQQTYMPSQQYYQQQQQQTSIPPQQYSQQQTYSSPQQYSQQQQPAYVFSQQPTYVSPLQYSQLQDQPTTALINPPQLDVYRDLYMQAGIPSTTTITSPQVSCSQIPGAACYSCNIQR